MDKDSVVKPTQGFGTLPFKIELSVESKDSLVARAFLDMRRKVRLNLPDDWPDWPADLPEDLYLELEPARFGESPELEKAIGMLLEQALKLALEDVLEVEVELGRHSDEDQVVE